MIHEYQGLLPLIHVDLYRLPVLELDFLLALEDYWQQPVVTVIEWAERLEDELPEAYLDVSLFWIDEHSRKIEISGAGSRGANLAAACHTLPGFPAQSLKPSRNGHGASQKNHRS